MLSFKFFKHKVNKENKKIKKFYERKTLNGSISVYNISSICNGIGYPPLILKKKNNFFLLFFIKEFLKFLSTFLKIFFFFIFFRIFKKKFLKKIPNYKTDLIFENQFSLNKKLRKSITNPKKKNIFVDFNLQFLNLKNCTKIVREKKYICSFIFLKTKSFLKIIFYTFKTFFIDYKYSKNNLVNQKNSLSRIFYDLLKIFSLEEMLKELNIKKYIFFWENRGWQNHFLAKYNKKFIGIQLGVEGHLGPIYCNHRNYNDLKNSKILFESKFHFDDFNGRYKKLILFKKKNKYKIKKQKKLKNKALIFSGLDIQNTILSSKLANQYENIYFRPHPEMVQFANIYCDSKKIKFDQINNKFFEKYDFFISLGVTSFLRFLDQRGINYLQLINPNKIIDGFDLSKNKIISLNDLIDYNKLNKQSYKKNKNNKLFKMANKIFSYRDIK